MTGRKKTKRGMTAAELVAQLQGDKEYQRRTRKAEAERQLRTRELREAEAPIVADLLAAGVEVKSVWDLVNTSVPYPDALPVLVQHLKRGGYPDNVMESLARALAVGPAAHFWDTFRELYLKAHGKGEMEGLAVALAASAASASHLDGLIALLDEASRGDTRIHFLRAIKRIGGEGAVEILKSLRTDAVFGREARALLKTRR